MNKTELYHWLAERDLGIKGGYYNMEFQGFTWILTSLNGQTKYGDVTITNELIEREMPNIADELYSCIIGLLAKNHPEFFNMGAI